jgi:glycosyltransferase involved in cell wall biosynthesis
MEVLEWIDIGRSWPNVLKIKEALCAGDYALVHVNNTFTYQLPTLFAAHIAGIPVVAHVRNPIRACAFSRMAARLADCIVTVSRVFEKELNGWGLPIAVCTCYDCTELPATDQSVSSSLRVSLLGSGNVLIGSVGRLEEQKGYQDLVHAARRVIDLFPEVRFAIAGDGPLRPSLERSIAQLGLESKFRLCGFRSDVTNFLAALDLFVSSSHWEGLPLAIVEAMLLGKRVVATDVGGTSEVVLPGQTGELVPPSNPGAMAIAIAKFVSRPKDSGSWAKRTLQVASTLGDPDRNAQAFDEVIQGVMLEAGFAQADLTNSHW